MKLKKESKKAVLEKSEVRLNKYISNSGLCSRREADKYILKGLVSVNDKIVKDLGTKINLGDKIKFKRKIIEEKKFDYFLLNKSKGFIVTNQGEVKNSSLEDLFKNDKFSKMLPFGDMGRLITGLLLLTNDAGLIKRLNRSNCKINMLYQLTLDKSVEQKNIQELKKGIILEEKKYQVKELEYVEKTNNKTVGVKVFSIGPGLLKKIFKKFDYKILSMDRVVFAGFTKKDLPRGIWRRLNSKEVGFLKML